MLKLFLNNYDDFGTPGNPNATGNDDKILLQKLDGIPIQKIKDQFYLNANQEEEGLNLFENSIITSIFRIDQTGIEYFL